MRRAGAHQPIEPIDVIREGVALALWILGFDSRDIADMIGAREWQVQNLLPRLREQGR